MRSSAVADRYRKGSGVTEARYSVVAFRWSSGFGV